MNRVSSFASVLQRRAVIFARAHLDLQQFGQANDDEVWNGMTACTHTCLQFIYWFVTGKRITLNEVNRLAGMPKNATASVVKVVGGKKRVVKVPRGMRPAEVETFLRATHLPYKVRRVDDAVTFAEIREASKLGPVLYAMRYGSAPTHKGTIYHGVRAKAPFAIHRGRTQLTGFEDGRHAVLYLGDRRVTDARGRLVYIRSYRKEPNHGSPARRERPPFDVIHGSQARREYEDYRDRLGQPLYAVVPTRKVA